MLILILRFEKKIVGFILKIHSGQNGEKHHEHFISTNALLSQQESVSAAP